MQSGFGTVRKANGRCDRLTEFKKSKGRRTFLDEQDTQQRIDLRVEAGIAEAESETAHHREDLRSRDVTLIVSVLEWRIIRQIQEDADESEKMHEETSKHHWPATAITEYLGCENAEDGTAYDLAESDKDTGQSYETFTIFAHGFGEADAARVYAGIESKLQTRVDERE